MAAWGFVAMAAAPLVDLDEAKRRGSQLLLDVARACPEEIDPRPIGRVAYFLNPPIRRPMPDELFPHGAMPHDGIGAEIESAFASPTLEDLQYARDVLGRYVISAESEAEGMGGAERQQELSSLSYYHRCLAYLDEVIGTRSQN
jgi:hypothetical protein